MEAIFPARCLGCQRRGVALCGHCRPHLPRLPQDVCSRCATRRFERGGCLGCRRLSPTITSIRAAFAYEGAARSAVLTLKFRSGRYLAPLMGELMRETLERRPVRAEVVVPVPLADGRQRQRGFNQATLLAEGVCEAVRGTLVADLLTRDDRPPQSTLSAARRLRNLEGAFRCARPSEVRGRRVVLVDDVVTTGATVSACADTLAAAGARRIWVVTFARDL